MIYLQKSAASEEISNKLAAAKLKDDAKVYRDGLVYDQIRTDFHSKCYLCEDDEVTSIQIEHFDPHGGNLTKKYDWRNLFFSCGHCNNLKGDRYWPLLDCTDPKDQVWQSIEIDFTTFPKAMVEVKTHPLPGREKACENTRQLLESALSHKASTQMKKEEAAILRRKMLRVYDSLCRAIDREDASAVEKAIADDAPFAGLCRWTLKREFPRWYEHFAAHFETQR